VTFSLALDSGGGRNFKPERSTNKEAAHLAAREVSQMLKVRVAVELSLTPEALWLLLWHLLSSAIR